MTGLDIPSNREIRLSVTFTSKERREAGAEGGPGRAASQRGGTFDALKENSCTSE